MLSNASCRHQKFPLLSEMIMALLWPCLGAPRHIAQPRGEGSKCWPRKRRFSLKSCAFSPSPGPQGPQKETQSLNDPFPLLQAFTVPLTAAPATLHGKSDVDSWKITMKQAAGAPSQVSCKHQAHQPCLGRGGPDGQVSRKVPPTLWILPGHDRHVS